MYDRIFNFVCTVPLTVPFNRRSQFVWIG